VKYVLLEDCSLIMESRFARSSDPDSYAGGSLQVLAVIYTEQTK
jgi:hypothetical protein